MTDYPTREYIIRETTYPDATKQEAIGELVRCKDCLYWQKSGLFSGYMVCRYVVDCSVVRREDDFCSRGERKDGDGHDGS